MRRRAVGNGAAAVIAVLALVISPWLLALGGQDNSAGAAPFAHWLAHGRLASAAFEPEAVADVALKVYDHDQNRIVDMLLEDYVVSVLMGELPYDYEDETLKAQAVAARTYALYRSQIFGKKGMSLHPGADVCTESTHCQAYRSLSERKRQWGKSFEVKEARVVAIVAATKGELLTYANAPIEALYHSTSGGMTEDAANVFAQDRPYLKSVASRGEENTKRYEAEKTVARSAFAKTVNQRYPSAMIAASKLDSQVRVTSRTAAGRIETIRLGGATLTGREFRSLFGLDSANVSLSIGNTEVSMKTIGYGHGVGMSQVGAEAMAKDGADYREILTHYYSGVEITRLSSLLPAGH